MPAEQTVTAPEITTETTATPSTQTPEPQQTTKATTGVFDTSPADVKAPATHAPPPEAKKGAKPESTTAPEPDPRKKGEPEARVVPKPDEYALPEGVPKGIGEFAHKNDLTQAQLDATLKQFGGYVQAMQKGEIAKLRKQGEAKLKEWGDLKQTNLNLARVALKQNDKDGKFTEFLDKSGYGNHPLLMEFLAGVGRSMQEGGYIRSAIRLPPGKKTAAQSLFGDSHPTEQN